MSFTVAHQFKQDGCHNVYTTELLCSINLCQSMLITELSCLVLSIISERDVRYNIVVRPSVCRLSVCLSVTFVRPTQAIEIFGNVSKPFNTWAIH